MAQPAPQAEPADTKERLLDAAEALFMQHGSAGASLRSITTAAGTNLAAVNYHFGSKHGLLRAVVERRIGPANRRRLHRLDALRARPEAPSVEDILDAFLTPAFELHGRPELLPAFAVLWTEPVEVARPLIRELFGAIGERFCEALSPLLPHLRPDELSRRFQFGIGVMLHVLSRRNQLGEFDGSRAAIASIKAEIIGFVAAGLRAPAVGGAR